MPSSGAPVLRHRSSHRSDTSKFLYHSQLKGPSNRMQRLYRAMQRIAHLLHQPSVFCPMTNSTARSWFIQTPQPFNLKKLNPSHPACVLVFNSSDPSGAGGLSGDVTAIASVGAHALPIVTGAYARDTAEILDHFAFDEEAVSASRRAPFLKTFRCRSSRSVL
jgi:hypothetical protein